MFWRIGLAMCVLAGALSGCGTDKAVNPKPPSPSYLLKDVAWDVAPDGSAVLYSHGDAPGQPTGVYFLDTTAAATPRFVMPIEASGVDPNDLRISPDGKSIAFERGIEIWIRSIIDGSEHQVTFTDANAIDPDWDPTGQFLVYERPFLSPGAPDTSSGLFVVDLLTMEHRHLRHDSLPTYGGDARWSPDGTTIAFTYGSPLHLFRLNVNGTGYQDLTPTSNRQCENPEWIEGGNRLVFESFSTANRSDHHTRVVNEDGTGEAPYPVELRPYGTRSALSLDRGYVAYDSLDGNNVLVLYLKAASAIGASNLPRPRKLTTYVPAGAAAPTYLMEAGHEATAAIIPKNPTRSRSAPGNISLWSR
jgi:dipeptidyl aminopeptidase/acylaminoacyl peptidase